MNDPITWMLLAVSRPATLTAPTNADAPDTPSEPAARALVTVAEPAVRRPVTAAVLVATCPDTRTDPDTSIACVARV